ncbi:hypothetical protein [Methylobacterium fujisawaense]
MRARGLLVGLALMLPFWLAVIVGVAQMRGAAHHGAPVVMPWSAR